VRQIEATENIAARLGCQVVGGGGDGRLEHLVLRDIGSQAEAVVEASALFLLIGAQPNTDWLPPDIERDEQGFVLTGADVSHGRTWPLDRSPFLLETSMPGVFAAGDVRHGGVKRVASAVGEGSIAIQFLHQLFAVEHRQPRGRSEEHPGTRGRATVEASRSSPSPVIVSPRARVTADGVLEVPQSALARADDVVR